MSSGQLARTPDNFPRMKHRAAGRQARRPNPRLRLPEVLQSPRNTLDRRTRTQSRRNTHHREGNSLNPLGIDPKGRKPPTGTPQPTKNGKTKNEAKQRNTRGKRADLFLSLDPPTISPRA